MMIIRQFPRVLAAALLAAPFLAWLGDAQTAGAGNYSTAVLADNPVAYYRLGEMSGTTAANSSANGARSTETM